MQGKIVPFKQGFRLKVKYWFMFWFIDPGFPTFNNVEDAKKAAHDVGIVVKELVIASERVNNTQKVAD